MNGTVRTERKGVGGSDSDGFQIFAFFDEEDTERRGKLLKTLRLERKAKQQ